MLEDYPWQREREIEIAERFKDEFDLAYRLFNYWLYCEKAKWLYKSDLPGRVKEVAMVLNHQATRQYRSIVRLCESGEAFDAMVIAGSLFETAMASCFVLQPELDIAIVRDDNPLRTSKYRAAIPSRRQSGENLTQEFRAKLYQAHAIFNEERFATKLMTINGQEELAKKVTVDSKIIEGAESALGEAWVHILRKSHSYSGLSISDLAKVLQNGFEFWYQTIYAIQSRMTHANDAYRHMRRSAIGQSASSKIACISPDSDIAGALHTGTAIFLVCVKLVVDNIDFGYAAPTLIDELSTEFTLRQS